ncbi:exodeoxyribonuclease III [Candidatus Ishikawella capsulata]|uniref:Exonuclease III n=1 Tax=Candidatus Ishikawaella capsulata Mpkobe TaxID=476281 RepID=C5WCL8_9ENTR|nr:exodeoxyribonuclease III [Candidatus Ishikawaella capsulata]BAH83074.1 exonuclease III [Candidatus Ishikawaella capsulata Mpkobe]
MKVISFNINGIRARLHQLEALVRLHNPDIIGLQETKVHDDFFPREEINTLGYKTFFYGQKKDYGVAILCKHSPIKIYYGFPDENIEISQKRIIITEFISPIGNITIINGYFPQGNNRNDKIKFAAKEKFFHDLQSYLETKLTANTPILIIGDINISATDNDIGIGETQYKKWLKIGKCSFLPEERFWIKKLLDWGLIDIWRFHNPNVKNRFSWFDYKGNNFVNNRGLRIDSLLVSSILAKCCVETGIDYKIRSMYKPSDHAPIWAKFDLD